MEVPLKPLEPPISLLIDCLALIVPDALHHIEDETILNKLIHILGLATRAYDEAELGRNLAPLLKLLFHISEMSTFSRKHLQAHLLPSGQDRRRLLGVGDSLPARLLRRSTAVETRRLKVLIVYLFFGLSGRDQEVLVQDVEYGYASGFLPFLGELVVGE